MGKMPDSQYMKIAEAARFLGVTQRWVYRRVLSGELPASKVGGLYFINRKDLQALLDAGRVTPEINPEKRGENVKRLKCGFCYRLLQDESEIGGTCEKEGCAEIICVDCWKLNIHACAQHSPNREQRQQRAAERFEAGQLPILVKSGEARLAETTFLNRIHSHLSGFPTLIHPATGEVLNISSWDEALESGDERAELMHLLGKVALESSTIAQMPLNSWYHYALRAKNKKATPLEIHVQAVSRLENMARDGFDTQPLDLAVMNFWIERLIEQPAGSGLFRLVVLASPTGWGEDCRAAVRGGRAGYAYSHRLALLYLFDWPQNELIFNNGDDRTRRYAELFRPVLGSEEIYQLKAAILEKLSVFESLTLAEAMKTFPDSADKVKQVFELIAKEGKYQWSDFPDLGPTLVKRSN